MVESTLVIPPIWFNAVGGLYFLTLLMIGIAVKRKVGGNISVLLLRLLLLCGITAEGVLVSYQIFVVQTFCSYCLFICALIMCMNVLAGWRHALSAFLTFGTVVTLFSLLQFQNPVGEETASGIDKGTYALKKGPPSERSFYLLFSEDCPHCHRVMEMLDNSNAQCGVRYNPIDPIAPGILPFPHMTATDSYDPKINRALLKGMEIKTVPILVEKHSGDVRFISGGDAIMEYLKQHCFAKVSEKKERDVLQSILQDTTNQDECQVDTDCGTSADQSVKQFF